LSLVTVDQTVVFVQPWHIVTISGSYPGQRTWQYILKLKFAKTGSAHVHQFSCAYTLNQKIPRDVSGFVYVHKCDSYVDRLAKQYNLVLLFLLFLWGPLAYASGSPSALWLIVLSP
jgi:hypothetical protein